MRCEKDRSGRYPTFALQVPDRDQVCAAWQTGEETAPYGSRRLVICGSDPLSHGVDGPVFVAAATTDPVR